MRQVKKVKFRSGRDANRALVSKLAGNLIQFGKVETTMPKARVLKSTIDRLIYKAQKESQSHKNGLLSVLHHKSLVDKLFSDIAPRYQGRTGGYVRIVKVGFRQGDGAALGRVEWVEGAPQKEVRSDPFDKTQGYPERSRTDERLEAEKTKKAIKAKATKKVKK